MHLPTSYPLRQPISFRGASKGVDAKQVTGVNRKSFAWGCKEELPDVKGEKLQACGSIWSDISDRLYHRYKLGEWFAC